jgi:hypothetical protein
MTMLYQLPGLRSRVGKAQPVYNVVKSALQQNKQILTGKPRAAFCLAEVTPELALQHPIDASRLLFLTQLTQIVRRATTAEPGQSTVLTGWITPISLKRALGRKAPLPLQKQLFAFTTADLANRACISGHSSLLVLPIQSGTTHGASWADDSRYVGSA